MPHAVDLLAGERHGTLDVGVTRLVWYGAYDRIVEADPDRSDLYLTSSGWTGGG